MEPHALDVFVYSYNNVGFDAIVSLDIWKSKSRRWGIDLQVERSLFPHSTLIYWIYLEIVSNVSSKQTWRLTILLIYSQVVSSDGTPIWIKTYL